MTKRLSPQRDNMLNKKMMMKVKVKVMSNDTKTNWLLIVRTVFCKGI